MVINLTDENFEKEINSAEKLVLVDFFAEWCGPCKMLTPILEKVANEMKEKIILLKADLDNIPNTANKFGIERVPTVVMFKAGKPISGFVGLAPEQAIKDWILNAENSDEGISENTNAKSNDNANENANENINEIIERYDNYAKSNGFRLNPDRKIVEGVITGLLANEKKYGKKYCPCRRVSGDREQDAKIICPCVFHKDEIAKDGHCYCNLYVK